MSFEEMQSTMQFLLQQQGKNAVILERHEERMNSLRENFRLLTELAQNHDERTTKVLMNASTGYPPS